MEFPGTKKTNSFNQYQYFSMRFNIFQYLFFFRKNRNPTVNGKMPSVANSPTSGTSDHITDGMAGQLVLDNVRHPIGK